MGNALMWLNLVDLGLSILERYGMKTAEFMARRDQRIAEGHKGLTDADVDEFQAKLKGHIDILNG
jgi:hypothetical protein